MQNLEDRPSLVREWIKRAEDDELNARSVLRLGTRYVADIPLETFTWQLAEEAFKATLRIKEFALEKLP